MLPQEVVGRYRRYKRGTRKLVYWLVRTVNECGDLEAILHKLPTTRKQSSKKGKKKKDKKSAAELAEIEVQTSQLVQLAEAISKAEPPTMVPEYIISTAREVIAGREECHVWYSSQTLAEGSDVKEQNDTHHYFIQTLQSVLDLLLKAQSRLLVSEPLSNSTNKASTQPNGSSRQSDAKADSLNTAFEWLSVEEPSKDALGDEPPALTVKTSSGTSQVQLRLEQQDQDSAFQTWCFLQDLSDVRSSVKQVWEEYAQGETSFLNASMVTDAAFGLLRRADEDFEALSPAHCTDWQKLLKKLGLRYSVRHGGVRMHSDTSNAAEETRMFIPEISVTELLCPLAFLCLDDYRSAIQVYCQAQQHGADVAEAGSVFHDVHELTILLYEAIPNTHGEAHADYSKGNIIVDEFAQGLSQIHRTSSIRMWIVAACQICIDLYDRVGAQVFSVSDIVRSSSIGLHALMTDFKDYARECRHPLADLHGSFTCLNFAATSMQCFRDSLDASAGSSNQPSLSSGATGTGKTDVFRNNPFPATAGGLLSSHKLFLYSIGCDVMTHGSFVLLAANLYRAYRGMGIWQAAEWSDMDFVLSSFGSNQPLVSPKEGVYDDVKATRHLLLDLGMSPRAFAADRRPGTRSIPNTRAPRKMSISSPLLRSFTDDGVLNWFEHGMEHARINSVEAALCALTNTSSGNKKGATSKQAASQTQARHSFTPATLLHTMTKTLRADEPNLNFDYIGFTLACARLMQAVHTTVNTLAPVRYDHTLGAYARLAGHLLLEKSRGEIVMQVAALLEGHVQTKGDVFLQKAKAQCSGSLVEEYRPATHTASRFTQ